MSITFTAAASAMNANARAQEIIARNLANANTTGFKKGVVVFEDFSNVLADAATNVAPAIVADSQELVDYSEGSHTYTGNTLDVALQGEGFFVLQNPDPAQADRPLYTRKGQFTLDETGQLVNTAGFTVMGESGAITFPADAQNILITADGSVSADGNSVGRLMVVDLDRPYTLERTNFTAFREPESVEASQPAAGYQVRQGYLEESNVDILTELVTMISVLRNFEANQRSVATTDEALKQLIASV